MEHEVEHHEGIAVIRPEGDLDVTAAFELRTVLGEQLAPQGARVVLDLERVPFIDSSGVGVLVGATKRAAEVGGALVLAAPGEALRKIFSLTRTHRVLRVEPTVREALAALAG